VGPATEHHGCSVKQVVIDNQTRRDDQSVANHNQKPPMKTASFLTALRQQASLPLVFRTADHVVSPGYHLTEVKRVTYDTMDCGGLTHQWSETQFEIWVPPLSGLTPGRTFLSADKFLRIINRVEAALPLAGETTARVHASFAGQPAALYEITSLAAADGRLWVNLAPDRTRCKAAERRLGSLAGCCVTREDDGPAESEGCGCASSASTESARSVCCSA
jgi:hypothetical protein